MKKDARLSLMSHNRLFKMKIAQKYKDFWVFAGVIIPHLETKESRSFNCVTPPGQQLHKSECLSQSVAGRRTFHLRSFIFIDGIKNSGNNDVCNLLH